MLKRSNPRYGDGFSLVEVLVAIALSLLIMGGALNLFQQGTQLSSTATLKTEMQQNARAAINLLAQDLSLSGTAFPLGGVQLPTGANSQDPRYGCDVAGNCYRQQNARDDRLYAMTPGDGVGPTINGTPTDVVTLVYRDPNSNLDQSPLTTINADGTSVTAVSAAGIQQGDVLVLCNANGCAAAVVTSVSGSTINLADNDPLKFNQSNAGAGNVKALANSGTTTYPPTSAYRVNLVRYFIDETSSRLMRQMSAFPPVPVAENFENLQISYDTFDDATLTATSNLADLPNTVGILNQIRKVNINVSVRGAERTLPTKQFDRFSLRTSVSTRNLAFRDRYQ